MKKRLRASVAVVAALLLCLPLAADSVVLVPREVFVGDSAELSFTTRAFDGILAPGDAAFLSAADLPLSPDATVTSVRVAMSPEGTGSLTTVSVTFIPWVSGPLSLPSFTVRKVQISPPSVRIMSLVDKTGRTTLEGPRSPLLVPGTTYLLYGAIAAALAVFVALIVAIRRIGALVTSTSSRKGSARRVRLVLRRLRSLERSVRHTEILPWYSGFSLALRSYLGELCVGDSGYFLPATVTEIAEEIRFRFENSGAGTLTDTLRALLLSVDVVRFSGRPAPENRVVDLLTFRNLIPVLEEAAAAAAETPIEADTAPDGAEGEAGDAQL